MCDFERYRVAFYRDGGRGPLAFDCWGLVRDVLLRVFGVPDLPSFGVIAARDYKAKTQAADRLRPLFERVELPQIGVIAAGYLHDFLFHVGVVVELDGRLWVLHAHQDLGIVFDTVERFAAVAGNRVEYYQYVG